MNAPDCFGKLVEMVDKINAVVTSALERLPVEIRINIFSQFDAKTLARLRCVSKSLSSFISTPDLIAAHRLHSRRNPHLLFVIHKENGSESLHSVDINTKHIIQVIAKHPFPAANFLVKTCLELVCMYNRHKADEIYIFNPTNKHSLPLPPLNLTYRSSEYSRTLFFGYVASTNEYKVLCITRICSKTVGFCIANAFTIGTDKRWRNAEDPPPHILFCCSALVNEAVYCLHNDIIPAISKFDLEKEEWSVLRDLPFTLKLDCYFMELGGRLCYVEIGDNRKNIGIWMLQNSDSYSWSKEYHIDIRDLIKNDRDYYMSIPRVLTMDKSGRILIFLNLRDRLVYYDPSSGSFEEFHVREKLGLEDGDWMRIPNLYLDSLMSLEDLS